MIKQKQYCIHCGARLEDIMDNENRRRKSCSSCGWIFFDNPLPIVLILAVTQGGKILYTRNKEWPAEMWGLVAGYIEQGETAEEAAIREVYEESGLIGVNPQYLETIAFRDQLLICYRVTIPEGQIHKGVDVEAVELSYPGFKYIPDWAPARKIIGKYIEKGYNLEKENDDV